MYVFCSSFFPVSRTFSALMTITKSPVSTCGVKTVFSLPRNRFTAFTATLPSTWSAASITHHLRGTSLALAENVFIIEKGHENYGRRKDLSTHRQPMRHMSQLGLIIMEMLAGELAFARLILCPCPTRHLRLRSHRAGTKTFRNGISRCFAPRNWRSPLTYAVAW